MEAILDFSRPFDPSLVDQIITVFYNPQNPEVDSFIRRIDFVAANSKSSSLPIQSR